MHHEYDDKSLHQVLPPVTRTIVEQTPGNIVLEVRRHPVEEIGHHPAPSTVEEELEEVVDRSANEQETLYREDIIQEALDDASINIALRREDLDDSFTHIDLVTDTDTDMVMEDTEQLDDDDEVVERMDNSLQSGDDIRDEMAEEV